MRILPFRARHILLKDIQCTLNRMPVLLGIYVFYFIIAWFPLREMESMGNPAGPVQRLFWPLFMIQTALVLTFMLLPQYVYRESMTEKHETYFAYGFSVMDIVTGKSMLLTLLSLVPAILFVGIVFPRLTPEGLLLPVCLIAVAFFVFSLIGLIVFLTWFSRLGRLAVVVSVPAMVVFFRHARSIMEWTAAASRSVVLAGMMGSGVLIWALLRVSLQWGNQEKFLIRR